MAFLDRFFKSPKPPELSPDQLKDALCQAISRQDQQQVMQLCRAYQEQILQCFPQWQKPGGTAPSDPTAMQQYVQFLGTVADCFAKSLGKPELWQQLVGPEDTNPLLRWEKALQKAESLWGEHKYIDAVHLLADLLIDVRQLQGSGVDTFLPKTYGHLGYSYFQAGEAGKAIGPWEKALELCHAHHDVEGERAYLDSLYEGHRYLEQPEPAARYAERLADVLAAAGDKANAAWYRTQATIVRRGEPLNRMVAVMGGSRFELDELPPLGQEAHIQFEFQRNRVTLRPARELSAEGARLGSNGQFSEALSAFRAAGQADRFDPQCRYEEGVTLLHLEQPLEAVECFRAVEELAPGWFYCRRYLSIAEQMVEGRLPHAVFLGLQMLDGNSLSPEDKVKLAEEILHKVADVGWLYLELGKNLRRLHRQAEAEKAYRKGLACASDADIRTCLLIELALLIDSASPERDRLLKEAFELKGNLLATVIAHLQLMPPRKA